MLQCVQPQTNPRVHIRDSVLLVISALSLCGQETKLIIYTCELCNTDLIFSPEKRYIMIIVIAKTYTFRK